MKPMLMAKNLSVTRAGREILNIEELRLNQGEVLALVGPNGAGKSTLLLTLALLESPATGTVYLDGEAAQNGNILTLRRRIALVFQEALLLDASVWRNLTIPLRIRGVARREAASRADKWLDRFGIAHLSNRSARYLSGGEAQRTSLARAFALEPEVLFLDEPFSALDYPTRKSLLGELGAIISETKLTTLFVTHDYTEIPHLAQKAAVLYEGKITKHGSVREIFGDEIFQKKMCIPWED